MQVISFFTAKGGTGKTTFNMLLASYLKYKLGKQVAMMDFDGPEYNLTFCRSRELEQLSKGEAPVDEKGFYPVIPVRDHSREYLEALAKMVPRLAKSYDYLIMDFKGSLQMKDPVSVLAQAGVLDKVVIPVELDPMIIASMKSLAQALKANVPDTLLFFNRVHGKEKPEQYEAVRAWFEKHDCKVARSLVKMTIGLKREQSGRDSFLRSTVCFQDKTIRRVNPGIIGLFDEVLGYE